MNFNNFYLKSSPVQANKKKKSAGARRRRQDMRHSARAWHSRAEKKRVLCIVHYLLNKTVFLLLTALALSLLQKPQHYRGDQQSSSPRSNIKLCDLRACVRACVICGGNSLWSRPTPVILQRELPPLRSYGERYIATKVTLPLHLPCSKNGAAGGRPRRLATAARRWPVARDRSPA